MEQKKKVYELLDSIGIKYEAIDHPAAYTIEEMDHIELFRDNHWIAKNLFLRDDKGRRHFLIVLDKYKTADLKSIRAQLGTSGLSFASEERLMKYLKLTKGSVTPFGILNDDDLAVEVIFDSALIGRDLIGVHPNDNTATVMLSCADLMRIIQEHGNKVSIVEI